MEDSPDPYERLRPPPPTVAGETCSCPPATAVKLMHALGPNPIHCLECNREVSPERLGLDRELASAIADWLFTYGAIDQLELASGEYEAWAREVLLNPHSPPNREGLAVTARLNELVPSYCWLWQPQADESWRPPSMCPLCGGALTRHDTGVFPQLLCERDRLVVAGG